MPAGLQGHWQASECKCGWEMSAGRMDALLSMPALHEVIDWQTSGCARRAVAGRMDALLSMPALQQRHGQASECANVQWRRELQWVGARLKGPADASIHSPSRLHMSGRAARILRCPALPDMCSLLETRHPGTALTVLEQALGGGQHFVGPRAAALPHHLQQPLQG